MFVDFAKEGAFNRNNPVELEQVLTMDLTSCKDCYRTYFAFNDDFKDYLLKNKSVKGYKGLLQAFYLPFDIDNLDLEKARLQARRLIECLQIRYDLCNEDIECFFTGAKGFHIQIPAEVFGGFEPSEKLAEIFRELALEISAGVEIDPVIYEPMRLWRLPNTINSKTGLFKIQLSVYELHNLSIDEIKELAKAPRELKTLDFTFRQSLRDLYRMVKDNISRKKIIPTSQKIYPANEKYCIYKILNEGVPQGERNNAIIRLAVYFNQKFNQSIVESIIKTWNTDFNIGISDNEITRTITSSLQGYGYGCSDGLLSKYCDQQKCSYSLKKKDNFPEIKTIETLEKDYLDYIKQIDEVKIDLKGWLPKFEKVTRGITAGEVVVVIAGAGIGKSAFLQNLLWHCKYPTIFFSYEMPEVLTYERFYQIANSCSGEKVESDYIANNVKSVRMKEGLKNTYFTFASDTNIDNIPKIVKAVEIEHKQKIRVTAIDYLGLVKGGQGSRYERVSYVAEKLKDIAKQTNTVVFCLAQVSRAQGAKGNEELTLTSGKDSGSVENTGDVVLGLWRPYKNKLGDSIIRIEILKNRKGKDNIHIDCSFNKETLEINEMNTSSPTIDKVKDTFDAEVFNISEVI